MKTQSATPLEIFCELMCNYKVISKSVIGPDDIY